MLLKKVIEDIKKNRLIANGDKIIIGASGGPDSTALVFILKSLQKKLNLKLHVAHLDHMLRVDSFLDCEFVKNLAQRLKIPVTCARINIKEMSKKGSAEEIARNARLGFFFQVGRDSKAKKIALGHNLDDQAETVLMRILRGTGLNGLSGIIPMRKIGGFEIIRPLLGVSRKEIELYLKKRKIKPCIDSSNRQDIFFRNKIRNRLMPLLAKEYNTNIKEVLDNLAESAGYDYDYLNHTASRFIRSQKSRLSLSKLKKLHPAILRLVLRLGISRVKGDTRKINFKHVKELEELIFARPVKSIVDLPKGISAVKSPKYLYFFRKKHQ